MSPSNIAADLVPETAAVMKKTNGANGKHETRIEANGINHELRTPLNSLLILAQQLYENADGNLSEKQVSYAKTIHSCGDDLIQLINDILDLSKIESGYISTDFINLRFQEVTAFVQTTFRHARGAGCREVADVASCFVSAGR